MKKIFNELYYIKSHDQAIGSPFYVDALINDSMHGVAYWRTHKHHTCYKCHKKGHLASDCERICPLCANIHGSSVCVSYLYTLLEKIYEKACVLATKEHQLNFLRCSEALISQQLESYKDKLVAIKDHTRRDNGCKIIDDIAFSIISHHQPIEVHTASFSVLSLQPNVAGKSTLSFSSLFNIFKKSQLNFRDSVKSVSFYNAKKHATDRLNDAIMEYNNYKLIGIRNKKIEAEIQAARTTPSLVKGRKGGFKSYLQEKQLELRPYDNNKLIALQARINRLRKSSAGSVVIRNSEVAMSDPSYINISKQIKGQIKRAEAKLKMLHKEFDKSLAYKFDLFLKNYNTAYRLDTLINKKQQELHKLDDTISNRKAEANQQINNKKNKMYQKFAEINKKIDDKRKAFAENKNAYHQLAKAVARITDKGLDNTTMLSRELKAFKKATKKENHQNFKSDNYLAIEGDEEVFRRVGLDITADRQSYMVYDLDSYIGRPMYLKNEGNHWYAGRCKKPFYISKSLGDKFLSDKAKFNN